jgi:hypothetical protein
MVRAAALDQLDQRVQVVARILARRSATDSGKPESASCSRRQRTTSCRDPFAIFVCISLW